MEESERQRRRRARRRARRLRTLAKLVMLLAAVFLYLRFAPDSYNIARPLDLEDRPTFVTGWKLQLATDNRCYDALRRAGIRVERLPDARMDRGCSFDGVASLQQSNISWGGNVTLRCPMLAGLVMWELHVLQPEAERLLGTQVQRVEHYGTYSCRNINNAKHGRRSEHATANAVDIAGFVLADGRRISVQGDWGKRTAEGKFLERVRDKACKRFNTVLSPDYNSLHYDHFHFDNGEYESCS